MLNIDFIEVLFYNRDLLPIKNNSKIMINNLLKVPYY